MRLVIKVGTSTLAHSSGKLNIRRTDALCRVLADLANAGHEVILVSSGAIGMGVGKLLLKEKPKDISTKQAAAAVGQCELMYTYDRFMAQYGHTVAQLLLTRSDFLHEDRHDNLSNTINRLLQLGALPIINENDTVATDEIKVGDNDTLSALVASSVKADLLVILTDIEGLYDRYPLDENAHLLREIRGITDEIRALGGETNGKLSVGGMRTKLNAAEMCCQNGIDTVIAHGKDPAILYDIIEGNDVPYTRFFA